MEGGGVRFSGSGSGSSSGSSSGSAPLSLGFLVHRLLHCSQAEKCRDFLCEKRDISRQLFAALEKKGGFKIGSIAACAGDRALVRLLACFSVQIASSGAGAQAELVRHCCRYADAYLTLLLPHSQDCRVAGFLSLLAGCGGHEGLLPSAAEAPSYLRLLTALAGGLSSIAVGAAGASGTARGPTLPDHLARLLSACLASILEVTAAAEAELRQGMDSELAAEAGRGKAGKKGRGRQPGPEEVQARADALVRDRLPAEGIAAALGLLRSFAPRHMAHLLSHTERHSSPLVVAQLRLDLLAGRLPQGKHTQLAALGCVLQHGQTLRACLHASLMAALACHASVGPGIITRRSSSYRLVEVLATSKAALRCLSVAAGSGLLPAGRPDAQAEQRKRFVAALLCTRYGVADGAAGDAPPTCLRLLWQLVLLHPGACCLAARRACDILLWCLPPPFPELADLLLAHAPAACPAEELAAQLRQAEGAPGAGRGATPFWKDLARALVSSTAAQEATGGAPASATMRYLQKLLAAEEQKSEANRLTHPQREAEKQGRTGAQSLSDSGGCGDSESLFSLIRKGEADLEAADGFATPAPAQQAQSCAAPVPAVLQAAIPGSPAQPAAVPAAAQTPTPAQPFTSASGSPGIAASGATGQRPSSVDVQQRLQALRQQLELKRQQKAAAEAAAALPVPAAGPAPGGASAAASNGPPAVPAGVPPSAPTPVAPRAARHRLPSDPQLSGCSHGYKPSSSAAAPGSSPCDSPVDASAADAISSQPSQGMSWDGQLGRLEQAGPPPPGPSWAGQTEECHAAGVPTIAESLPGSAGQASGGTACPATPLRGEPPKSSAAAATCMPEPGGQSCGAGLGQAEAAAACKLAAEMEEKCLHSQDSASQSGRPATQPCRQDSKLAMAGSPAGCQPSRQQGAKLTAPRLAGEVAHTPRPPPAAPPVPTQGAAPGPSLAAPAWAGAWHQPSQVEPPAPTPGASAAPGPSLAAPAWAWHQPAEAKPVAQPPPEARSPLQTGEAAGQLEPLPAASAQHWQGQAPVHAGPFGAGPQGAGQALCVPADVAAAQAAAGCAPACFFWVPPSCGSVGAQHSREAPGSQQLPLPGPQLLAAQHQPMMQIDAAVAAGSVAPDTAASPPAGPGDVAATAAEDMEVDGGSAAMEE